MASARAHTEFDGINKIDVNRICRFNYYRKTIKTKWTQVSFVLQYVWKQINIQYELPFKFMTLIDFFCWSHFLGTCFFSICIYVLVFMVKIKYIVSIENGGVFPTCQLFLAYHLHFMVFHFNDKLLTWWTSWCVHTWQQKWLVFQ